MFRFCGRDLSLATIIFCPTHALDVSVLTGLCLVRCLGTGSSHWYYRNRFLMSEKGLG